MSVRRYLAEFYAKDKIFIFLYAFFLLSGAYLMIFYPKGWLVLLFDSIHTPELNLFFRVMTFCGDGFFLILLSLAFMAYRLRYGLYLLIPYLLSGLFAQILKRIFDMPRPKACFAGQAVLHFVPGVEIYSFHSFPSGHTATAFSFCLLLSLLTRNKPLKALSFFWALFIGVSRIYLGQHFLMDVYFGSITGIIATILFDYFATTNTKYKNAGWADYSLIKKIL